ncbi:MAG TPA: kelch repeat-containing protein [Thermoplasmata archaeon]
MRGLFPVATVAVLLSVGTLAGDFYGTASARGAVLPNSLPFGSETDWTNMDPSDAPAAFANMAMVYDSDAHRMIVFGGYVGGDHGTDETWAYDFDTNTWTDRNPDAHPPAGWLDRAAYDSGSRQTILFGGWVGTVSDGTYSNETWAYDFSSNTWTNLSPAEHPSARSRQGMAYDAQSARTILFGGHTIENRYDNETWAYDATQNRWTNMTPAVAPPGRRSPGMAYDSKADRIILFGGVQGPGLDSPYNDTWAYDFDTNTWTNVSPPESPSGKWGMGFSYDSGVDRCILFGGAPGGDTYTWAYDSANNTWSLLRPHHSPPDHAFQGMAYDSQSARTIMFGGGSGDDYNDTWALATAPGPPSAPDDIWIRPGNGTLELHWRAPPDDGMSPITGYRIYRSTAPGQEALFAEVGNVDTWTDSNVTNGETYYYQLSAINAYGEGPRSGAVFAEPDGTPPVTSASLSGHLGNEGWWLSTVYVTLTASDDNSGVASTSFRVDGGAWQTYGSRIAVRGTGEHTVDFYSTDNAGNVEGSHRVGFRIDTTAPLTTISLDGAAGDDYWFHSIVTVDIAATDAGSGVDSIQYRLDGGTWATYSAPFDVGEGEHTVDAYAVDVAGTSGWVVSRSFGIDTTPPITTAEIAGPPGENGWYVGAVQVTLAATDALGTPTIWVRVDGGSWTRYTSPLLFDTGVHMFDYYAVDDSGLQEEVQTQTVSIDSAAPTVSASLPPPAASGWYTSPIPIEITASDALSGVASIFYRIDGGAWQTYAGSFLLTAEGDHTLEYVAVDSAGHRGSIQSTFVRIDTIAPVVSAPPARLVTTSQVTFSWTGTDAGSGIDHYEVRVDGGTFESVGTHRLASFQLADGLHTIVIRAIDRAGNEASTAFTVRVDTNPLSSSGPYGAAPLYAIVLAVITVAVVSGFVVMRKRRRVA